MQTAHYKEEYISQIPALQFLIKLGYTYLSPEQALEARGGRKSNVLLESILKKQLQLINKIEYKQKEYPFSETNINNAILALRDLPVQEGFMAATQAVYDLITLGKSLEQNILGDKKSFSLQYIDWEHPENNVFHVTEEFSVLRSERSDHYRPDIVAFINGIPVLVIECKSPALTTQTSPVELAIEQHERNWQTDGIRNLYHYSNVIMALAVNEASYATTGTNKKFWAVWKEQYRSEEESVALNQSLLHLKNTPLPENDKTILFRERYAYELEYFKQQEAVEQLVTEQDRLLYSLCRKERILDIIHHFILFDEGEKKIARYQQFFAVKYTLDRIAEIRPNGTRKGGVIWHTQGSGKSLTMVMLAQLIALHPQIKNPRIILVTDRIDLDDQITGTFLKCGKTVINAKTGADLVEYLESSSDAIITTIINKFQSAVIKSKNTFESANVFVLVDESHRSQHGTFNVKMQQVFPQACYIAFTGTPLLKKEKSTAEKFGGIIEGTVYPITQAVADKAVVPLLYEGRHNLLDVNDKPLDSYFEKIASNLSDMGKASLKKKFSARNKIVQSLAFIESTCMDIAEHFIDNIQGTGFKAQLVAPNKLSAIRYRTILKYTHKIAAEVVISAPDMREGEEDAYEISEGEVKSFWVSMMDKYGTSAKYEKALISNFKKQEEPEILIVVDKLLTGFDAPKNQVLYLTRQLRDHTLLQAIARVNRLAEGKDFGYVVDYFGNLYNLDNAMNTYGGLEAFDEADVEGAVVNIAAEVKKLPQAHSELWDLFKTIKNKGDVEAYEELLSDESIRHQFYEKLSVFARLLKLSLSTVAFVKETPKKTIDKYNKDARFFLALRVSVKRRYFDDIDYAAYEAQIQKLIDRHITAQGEVLKITDQVNIFDKEKREAEVEKIHGTAAKADHIASRTLKAISVKMEEDPVLYKRLSELIKETIKEYHQERITEAEYLKKAKEHEQTFFEGGKSNVPEAIRENSRAISFYNLCSVYFEKQLLGREDATGILVTLSLALDEIMRNNVYNDEILIIDWQQNFDVERAIRLSVDDYLYELNQQYQLGVSFDRQLDEFITSCINIAKVKYIQ